MIAIIHAIRMNIQRTVEPRTDWRTDAYASLGLWLALLLSWMAWMPGQSGSFLFDDFPNLQGLEEVSRTPTLDKALQFSTDGISSTLGRPLALATFALQYNSWPNNPADFISVNILLHLLNGVLLSWGLVRLFRLTGTSDNAGSVLAVATSAIWLFVPLHVSTVLYVVQRMALLSTTCMFLGMLFYLAGRQKALEGRAEYGIALMSLGIFTGLGLGVLAKENAALFPLMVLTTEFTLGQALPRPRQWQLWATACLGLPLLLLTGYLALQLPAFAQVSIERGLSMTDRLLTESRLLFLYLHKLFLPPLYNVQFLYDDFAVSRTLWSPWITSISVTGWLILLALSLGLRRRAPMLSFGVLWFLSCHLLESTIVPLELAFDHRNYTATAGPVLALVWYVGKLLKLPQVERLRPALLSAVLLYTGYLGTVLWHSASLWGQPMELRLFWGATQPDSRRAQHFLSDFYQHQDHLKEAAAVYEKALSRWPGDVSFSVGLLIIGCYSPDTPVPSTDKVRTTAHAFDGYKIATASMVHGLIETAESGECPRYTPAELWDVVEAIYTAPAFVNQRQNHHLLRSRIAELAGERANARIFLDYAIAAKPTMPLLVQAVYWALQAGDLDGARRYLTMAETHPTVSPVQRWSHRQELNRFRDFIQQQTGITRQAQ